MSCSRRNCKFELSVSNCDCRCGGSRCLMTQVFGRAAAILVTEGKIVSVTSARLDWFLLSGSNSNAAMSWVWVWARLELTKSSSRQMTRSGIARKVIPDQKLIIGRAVRAELELSEIAPCLSNWILRTVKNPANPSDKRFTRTIPSSKKRATRAMDGTDLSTFYW